MSKVWKLRTGMLVTDGYSEFPEIVQLNSFDLNGTQEEIAVKVIRNLAAVFAKAEDPENFSGNIKDKQIKLTKYLIKYE